MWLTRFLTFSFLVFCCFSSGRVEAAVDAKRGLPAIISLLLDDQASIPTPGEPGSFKGRVSLPSPVDRDVSIIVSTEEFYIDVLDETRKTLVEVVIPQGQRSAPYQIDLFEDPPLENSIALFFECSNGCDGLNLTTAGYWSATTGVATQENRTLYPYYAINTVNIQLEQADIFSGEISLPMRSGSSDQIVTLGDESLFITISEPQNLGLDQGFTFEINPVAGLSSIPFEVGVPTGSSSQDWVVQIKCAECDEDLESGTLFVTGTLGVYSLDQNAINASTFTQGNDHSGVSFELLVN